jgi:hypothetical protein
MDDESRRAKRLRIRLDRWGWELRECPANLPNDPAWGTFEVIDVTCGFGPWPGPWEGMYGASLYEIEQWLGWFERSIDDDPLDPLYSPEPRRPQPTRRHHPIFFGDGNESFGGADEERVPFALTLVGSESEESEPYQPAS